MQVITSPTVTIVSKTHFIGAPSFDIPDDGDDAVKLGSLAAKICYASSGKDGRSNIDNQKSILEISIRNVYMIAIYIVDMIDNGFHINLYKITPMSMRSTPLSLAVRK